MKNQVQEIIDISKYLFNRKLVSGKAGNISSRFNDIIAITPTLKSLNDLKDEDVVLVDINGKNLTKGKASSEINLHLEIYKKRKDVNGIVHTHSPYATGFSFSNKKIKRFEGFGKIKNEFIAEIDYEVPGSDLLAKKASDVLKNEDVLVLKNHGLISIGNNLNEACALAEFVENTAKTQLITHILNIDRI